MTDKTIRAIRRMHKQNRDGVTIRIKTFGEQYMPEKIAKGDWIDLRAHGEYTLKKGEQKYIMLGVAMELPEGYEAYVVPRSSMTARFGIIQVNSPGIIDRSFCGDSDEWGLSVMAVRDTVIHDKDRVCQFRIQRNQPAIEFVRVEHLGNPSRGGWGSTGVK
jgi:dUTP pyrophosphatase